METAMRAYFVRPSLPHANKTHLSDGAGAYSRKFQETLKETLETLQYFLGVKNEFIRVKVRPKVRVKVRPRP
jgi:hypothetical protein